MNVNNLPHHRITDAHLMRTASVRVYIYTLMRCGDAHDWLASKKRGRNSRH